VRYDDANCICALSNGDLAICGTSKMAGHLNDILVFTISSLNLSVLHSYTYTNTYDAIASGLTRDEGKWCTTATINGEEVIVFTGSQSHGAADYGSAIPTACSPTNYVSPMQNKDVVVGILKASDLSFLSSKTFSKWDIVGTPTAFDNIVQAEYGPITPHYPPLSDSYASEDLIAAVWNGNADMDDEGTCVLQPAGTTNELVVSALINVTNLRENNAYELQVYFNRLRYFQDCNAGQDQNVLFVDNCFKYGEYYDGYAYLLKLDVSPAWGITISNTTQAKYTGHFSGGDFRSKIHEDLQHNIIISGTTADGVFNDGQPGITHTCNTATTHDEESYLIKTDANFNLLWRRHFIGQGEGTCCFGFDLTEEGGYIICGNECEEINGVDGDFHSVIKLAPDCQNYQDYSQSNDITNAITINSTATWTTQRDIRGRIIVANGGILNIQNTTLNFGYSRYLNDYYDLPTNGNVAGITVNPGGKLIITNSHLEPTGCGDMWDGIKVLGNPGSMQVVNATGQGLVDFSGGEIKDAVIGICSGGAQWSLQNLNYNVQSNGFSSNVFYRGANYDAQINLNGGGIVKAYNGRFLNCYKDALFCKYTLAQTSYFINETFKCHAVLADDNYVNAANLRLGTTNFMQLNNIYSNLPFYQCIWQGNSALGYSLRGKGLVSYQSKIKITTSSTSATNTSMSNLLVGVESSGPTAGLINTAYISKVTFDFIPYGINLRNTAFDEVFDNHFTHIPNANSLSPFLPTRAIFAASSKGSLFQNNTIGGNANYGLILDNSVGNDGLVVLNTIDNADISAQFQQANTPYDVRCNTFSNADKSFVVASGTLQDQYLPDNHYPDNCPAGQSIDIYGSYSATTLSYVDKVGNVNPANANCISGNVAFNVLPINSPPNCIYPNPSIAFSQGAFIEKSDNYENSNYNLEYRNDLMQYVLHQMPDDSTDGSPTSILSSIKLLSMRQTQEDIRLLVAAYYALGNIDEAGKYLKLVSNQDSAIVAAPFDSVDVLHTSDSLMNRIVGNDDETKTFKEYWTILITAAYDSLDYSSLNRDDMETISGLANVKDVSVRYYAQSLLDQVYNDYYDLVPEPINNARLEEPLMQTAKSFFVYPNPASEEINVGWDFGNETGKNKIVVTDVTGKIIYTEQVYFIGRNKINTAALAGGVYLVSFMHDDLIKSVLKVAIVR
ncbi:MAG: T9SS C-terminal target domain-containing protein, partial [Sphingobacteriales bacterium]